MKVLRRYDFLVEKDIVKSRKQLNHMIDRDGFPPGFLLSPQVRVWEEDDIERWLELRKSMGGKATCGGRTKPRVRGNESA